MVSLTGLVRWMTAQCQAWGVGQARGRFVEEPGMGDDVGRQQLTGDGACGHPWETRRHWCRADLQDVGV